jgi:hypothetical protein
VGRTDTLETPPMFYYLNSPCLPHLLIKGISVACTAGVRTTQGWM